MYPNPFYPRRSPQQIHVATRFHRREYYVYLGRSPQ